MAAVLSFNPWRETMTRTLFFLHLLTTLFSSGMSASGGEPQVAWHGTLKGGLAEAARTGRPILLVSGLACLHQVPGIW